jgi:hypothetical protein
MLRLMDNDRTAVQLGVYQQVCENYRAIDDLRLKLLALLPLATGTGILVLLGNRSVPVEAARAVGAFGMIATLALYFYELHGVEKCAHFIHRGQRLEQEMDVRGAFRNRPPSVFRVVSELLPTTLVYPASFAGWLFLALEGIEPLRRAIVTAVALAVGVAASTGLVFVMQSTRGSRRSRLEGAEDAELAGRPD